MVRKAQISRKTNETYITLKIVLDGKGNSNINTGIGFLDHMLTLFSRHGFFDVDINASGDLNVDAHHTVEDIGIVLGQAIKDALGDKKSIKRYGSAYIPMDEALAMVALDISGRPFLVFDACFTNERVGDMDTELFEEFFRAFAFNAGLNLHIKVFYGSNNHHIVEAAFKAFARALGEACTIDGKIDGVMSTKGIL
jgi:imidazoleglycerol-phosphate dehydratase